MTGIGNVLFMCFQIIKWTCSMFNIIRLDILHDWDCPFLFPNGCVFWVMLNCKLLVISFKFDIFVDHQFKHYTKEKAKAKREF